MGNRYLVKFENFTPSATEAPTISSGAGRRLRVVEAVVGGIGASSAPQQLVMSRSATGTTPTNTITPTPHPHSEVPAATFTANRTWATAPAGAANGVILPFNALGGAYRWTANNNVPALEARNAEVIVFRLSAGITAQACSLEVMVEED
jgi:hypothetical protein